jgi:hypothetical protein
MAFLLVGYKSFSCNREDCNSVEVAAAVAAYASTLSGQCKNAHYLTLYARLAVAADAIAASTFHGSLN